MADVSRIFRNGEEYCSILNASEPVVVRTIPVFTLGRNEPLKLIEHVMYRLILPVALPDNGACHYHHGDMSWPIDRHIICADETDHHIYACFSRREVAQLAAA